MSAEGRRVGYDRFWGAMLLLGGLLPRRPGEPYPWGPGLAAPAVVWLVAVPLAGLAALLVGLSGRRGRWRHFANYALGVSCLAPPLLLPAIREALPEADPAALPIGEIGSGGWVMLVAPLAIYAGSGMRIVRPTQVPGQALGALGALLMAVFAFLPPEGGTTSLALARAAQLRDFASHWRQLLPFLLLSAASLLATLNLLRTRAEVVLAKCTRTLLLAALVASLPPSFLGGRGDLAAHLPGAWGALHLLPSLFLALDGAVAYVAITITRSSE